jgi:hypothetical protein
MTFYFSGFFVPQTAEANSTTFIEHSSSTKTEALQLPAM